MAAPMAELARYVSDKPSDDDHFGDKLRREASLLGNGILGIKDAAVNSVSREHIGETAFTATLSTAAGFGLSYLSRGRGLGYVASRAIALGAGAFFAKDLLTTGGDAAGAMANSWQSDSTYAHDKETMRHTVGQLGFDTALASAGSFAGAAAGNRLFRPHIPEPFMSQFNHKTGITEDYYNAFGANEMKMMMIQDGGNLPANIATEWRAEMPGRLRATESYTDYWKRQIATHLEHHPTDKLDPRGIHNALVRNYPNADRLNMLVSELRTFGDKDLTNPDVIKQLSGKFQQARTIIYGADNVNQTRALF
jgi:hypothetical protein